MSDETAGTVIIVAIIALIPAFIGRSKGGSFLGWWIFGVLFFLAALPFSLLIRRNQPAIDRRRAKAEGLKPCTSCAELIRKDARVGTAISRSTPCLSWVIHFDRIAFFFTSSERGI